MICKVTWNHAACHFSQDVQEGYLNLLMRLLPSHKDGHLAIGSADPGKFRHHLYPDNKAVDAVLTQVLITLDIGENSAISTMGEELDASFLVMLAVCNISVKRDQLVDRPLVTVEEAARCGCLTLRSLRDLYPMF